MMNDTIKKNALALTAELDWLSEVIEVRMQLYFKQKSKYASITEIPYPDCEKMDGNYAGFVSEHKLSPAERIVLILCLAVHVKPALLEVFSVKNKNNDRRYREFGVVVSNTHNGIIPTAETALFILAGDDMELRLNYLSLFNGDHLFSNNNIIELGNPPKGDPFLSSSLIMASDYIDFFTTGQVRKPNYGEGFPAKLVTTELEWDDIVLHSKTLNSIGEIKDWIDYGHILLNGLKLGKRIKPGYKSLFYGPPGTGKTMMASLLGKSTGRDVYKIDLGMVVSKFIGETEKNLAKVFDLAESRDWILFFDEADALFGKRTEVKSSNDRFANQEVAYLLQRVEDFPGVVILASNLNDNIDNAFIRRFQSMIHFPMPGVEERHRIWTQSFSEKLPVNEKVDLREIAEKYELSGGLMMNVIRQCTLQAVKHKKATIPLEDLEGSIRKEMVKDGIILT